METQRILATTQLISCQNMIGFIRDAGMALLGGWIVGIIFAGMKLTPPVPPLMGLIGAAGVLLGGVCFDLIVRTFFRS